MQSVVRKINGYTPRMPYTILPLVNSLTFKLIFYEKTFTHLGRNASLLGSVG